MQFDRISLGRQARELGFVRDTFEKVCRLADILSFMENDTLISDNLALRNPRFNQRFLRNQTGSNAFTISPKIRLKGYEGKD